PHQRSPDSRPQQQHQIRLLRRVRAGILERFVS
ncbi:hypothetical protein CCACVL1_09538, partial [Corchorus capsularis]